MGNRNIEISVVVSTIGRAEQLERSLEAFGGLDPGSPSFEVIVVLDGENRASRAVCSRVRDFPIEVLDQERAGSGPARNLGAEAARGELVVLIASMVWPGCWRRHMVWDMDFRSNYVLGILQPHRKERWR